MRARIAIALLEMAPARTGDRVGSMVVNPGGPARPAPEHRERTPTPTSRPTCATSFDIVGFDPRGTGASPGGLPRPTPELDALVAPIPLRTTAGGPAVRPNRSRSSGPAARRSPATSPATSTTHRGRARHGRAARRARRGDSCPTSASPTAPASARRTPSSSRSGRARFVLDGAIDPSLSRRESSLSQADGFEIALRAYLAGLRRRRRLPRSATPCDEGLQTDQRPARRRSTTEPLPTSDERDLARRQSPSTAGAPRSTSRTTGRSSTRPSTRRSTATAARCSASSDFYGVAGGTAPTRQLPRGDRRHQLPRRPWTSIRRSRCRRTSPSSRRRRRPSATSSPGACAPTATARRSRRHRARDRHRAPRARRRSWSSARPATRPRRTRRAVALAEQLDSGVLLSRDGDGHTAYNKGNACIDDAVHAYLDRRGRCRTTGTSADRLSPVESNIPGHTRVGYAAAHRASAGRTEPGRARRQPEMRRERRHRGEVRSVVARLTGEQGHCPYELVSARSRSLIARQVEMKPMASLRRVRWPRRR